MYKQSQFSLFLFILLFNYIYLRILFIPYIYKYYQSNGYIIIIFLMIVSFLIFLLIPKKIFNLNIFDQFLNSKIKYFITSIMFLRIILGFSLGTYFLKELYFSEIPYFIVGIGMILVSIVLSKLEPKGIIAVSTFFGFIINLFYNLYNFRLINYNIFSFSINKFDFDIITVLLMLGFIFDNFTILLTIEKQKLNKLNIIAGVLTSLSFIFTEYFILDEEVGFNLLSKNLNTGFFALGIEKSTVFSINYRFIYIMMITFTIIFKFSYCLSIFRTSFNLNKLKNDIILFIVFYSLSLGMIFYFINHIKFIYLSTLLLFLSFIIIPIYLFYRLKKNVKEIY